MPLHVVSHPLAGHLLTELRDRNTPPDRFRALCHSITILLALEATQELRLRPVKVMTPLCETQGCLLDQGLAVVPVLRAGLGMLEAIVQLFPDVAVGYIGMERHEDTAIARSYYSKLPNLSGRYTLCVDPMLATGGSAAQAIDQVKKFGGHPVTMVCVVAAPDGVQLLQSRHPDVEIFTAGLDERLNDRKYIVPGLGDFGDRLYGTP